MLFSLIYYSETSFMGTPSGPLTWVRMRTVKSIRVLQIDTSIHVPTRELLSEATVEIPSLVLLNVSQIINKCLRERW